MQITSTDVKMKTEPVVVTSPSTSSSTSTSSPMDLKITAPSTPSLLAFAKFKEREEMGSPTSPGMSMNSLPPRNELAEAAAFHSNFDESPDEDGDSDSDMPRDCKANTGRWTDAEHKLFLKGLECFPYRAWKKIATLIKTRSVVQIRTHAQKYYQKLAKEEAKGKDRNTGDSHFMMTGSSNFGSSHQSAASHADTDSATTRQKAGLNMKKRKFSFDENHYTRMPKRKEQMMTMTATNAAPVVDTKPTLELLRPPSDLEKSRAKTAEALKRRPVVSFDVPMIMEYPDEKHLEDYDDSLSRMTPVNDEDMLQLTDEDWFSSNSENALDDDNVFMTDDVVSPSSSPKKTGNGFLSVYHCDTSFDFEPETDPYSIFFEDQAAAAAATATDEFILDPQTFLTCYFKDA
ncbi:Aste57867_8753 [Aphanomyces stellatus]|uniref:Aste57867_8753 protein n=1 Tax=Aphanomyces stellatus TaxID=120398 RepID=A0A485KL59_9STRA|nr:hypothetical protein As57867_008719 [Aphanomyces stellatus]VFT85639.1 Aste57867_8753 [Aphanomyces stellatus]